MQSGELPLTEQAHKAVSCEADQKLLIDYGKFKGEGELFWRSVSYSVPFSFSLSPFCYNCDLVGSDKGRWKKRKMGLYFADPTVPMHPT